MLRLHFPNRTTADVPLNDGVCPVVRHASGQILAGVGGVGTLLLARFCVDARGIWLQVSDEGSRVHLNGRPVRRMAWIRPGDQVNVDGQDLHVLGRHGGARPGSKPAQAVLRAHGGALHGRAYPLHRGWVIGSSSQADIVLAEPGVPPLLLHVQARGEQVGLQVVASEGHVLLNGEAVRESALLPGDQITLPGHVRLVLEAPEGALTAWQAPNAATPADTPTPAAGLAPAARSAGRTWPWLLLAAIGLAGLLAALLLFGPR